MHERYIFILLLSTCDHPPHNVLGFIENSPFPPYSLFPLHFSDYRLLCPKYTYILLYPNTVPCCWLCTLGADPGRISACRATDLLLIGQLGLLLRSLSHHASRESEKTACPQGFRIILMLCWYQQWVFLWSVNKVRRWECVWFLFAWHPRGSQLNFPISNIYWVVMSALVQMAIRLHNV